MPLPDGSWKPGDPLFDPPVPHTPAQLDNAARLQQRETAWECRWRPHAAVPAPWPWLCGPAATEAGR